MRKPAMTPGALPASRHGRPFPCRHRSGARQAGAGTMLWSVGTHSLAFASEFGRSARARKLPLTLEGPRRCPDGRARPGQGGDRQAAREPGRHLGGAFPYPREASLMPRSALRRCAPTTDENEARGRDTAAQIAVESLPAEGRDAPPSAWRRDDTATELGSLARRRGRTARSASTALPRDQRARSASRSSASRLPGTRPSSIAKSHKHQGHRKWVAQR